MQKLPYMILKFILDNQLDNARTASSIFCPISLKWDIDTWKNLVHFELTQI